MIKNRTILIAYFSLVAILFIHAALYFTHQIPMTTLSDDRMLDTLFNADALYLPALYKDLFVEGGSFFGHWYLPPAPYYFPDMILYFILNAISGHYYYAIALFFMVEWAVLAWFIYTIYRLFFDATASIVWTSAVMFALYYFPSPVTHLMYISDFHYAELIVGMIMLYIVLRVMFEEKSSYLMWILYIILGLLTSASDKLILLQWVYPIALSSIIFLSFRIFSLKKTFLLLLLTALIFFGTRPLHDRLLPNPITNHAAANPTLSLDMLPRNIPLVSNIFNEAIKDGSFNFFILISISLASLGVIGVSLYKRRKKSADVIKISRSNFIALLLLIIISANTVAFLLTDREVNARHFAPLFMLPLIFLPIIINSLINFKISAKIKMLAALAILLLSLWQIKDKIIGKKFYDSCTTPFSRCIDSFIEQTGSKYGAAQYWQSKNIYMLSKYPVTIAQYDGASNGYRWITTNRWYRDEYDFVLIDHNASKPYYKINKSKIIRKNGKPDKTFWCGITEILYYKNGLKIQ